MVRRKTQTSNPHIGSSFDEFLSDFMTDEEIQTMHDNAQAKVRQVVDYDMDGIRFEDVASEEFPHLADPAMVNWIEEGEKIHTKINGSTIELKQIFFSKDIWFALIDDKFYGKASTNAVGVASLAIRHVVGGPV